jgi:hypothetical protein
MLSLERALAEPMLLGMMVGTQADAPAIGRLERHAAMAAGAHVCAFDGEALAPGDDAVMPANPRPVGRAGPV